MLAQVRFTNLKCSELAARYMCTTVEQVTSGRDRKAAYYKQIAQSQSESTEKPAGWDSAKPYSQVPGKQ